MSFTIARTLDEALAALAAGARPIAGGTDLVVGARHGKAPLPADLVAIDRIPGLAEVTVTAAGITIGAAVSHHTLEGHPLIASTYSALADGSALVGSPATRHVGTLGGNIMNASPAMDTGAGLTVLGAEVELRAQAGSRRVTLADLWTAPGRTSARPDELCVAVHVPTPAPRSGSAYLRLEYRRAMEIAVVGAAAAVTLAPDGSVAAVRVALSAVAPTILSLGGLETLAGGSVNDVAAAVAAAASQQATPISDVRATDHYRRHTVGVMARRAVAAAARRAAGETIAIPVNRSIGIGAAS
ncbi:MAG: FAD binding domain-containing protein [Actinomycetota bacterium]|nr:FAD binding domain-containing protein [Actinomycetota bacterium]